MADEPPASATKEKESPLDSLRKGIFMLSFVALPVGGMLVSAARLSQIVRTQNAVDLDWPILAYYWGAWAVGTSIILLGGVGKEAMPLVRSVVVGVGVLVLLLTGSP